MKEYKNNLLTVHWYPEICSHAGKCLKLPEVFNINQRPWININGAAPLEIISTIDKCPSGALKYSFPPGSEYCTEKEWGTGFLYYMRENPPAVKIRTIANGPLLIEGPAELVDTDGERVAMGSKLALCRCGLSCNRPFCDGTHTKKGWRVDNK